MDTYSSQGTRIPLSEALIKRLGQGTNMTTTSSDDKMTQTSSEKMTKTVSDKIEVTTTEVDVGDKDEAIAMVGEQKHVYDPAVAARAVRKIDWYLLPAMLFGMGLTWYDKAILGAAVLFDMTTDLSLLIPDRSTVPPTVDSSRLSWATSIFYFGFLAGLYPMSFALQRFPLGRILGVVVVVWAGVCLSTAGVTSYQGLYVNRFFLGFVESIIPSGFMCIVSSYYTQREQALRQSWWLCSSGIFAIAGSGLNWGFAQVQGGGLHRWQYIYLLAGSLTFLFGILCFALPNSPCSAWFLTPEERFAAVERLRDGQTGIRCTKFKMAHVKESMLDVKVWLIFVMMITLYMINGATSGFGPLIVSTFGWNTLESILFQLPLGAASFLSTLTAGYLGTRFQGIRCLMLAAFCLPVICGCLIIWKSEWSYHAPAPVVGYAITGLTGGAATLIVVVGMSNVAGHTKKSFMSATIYFGYCIGNIIGPQLIRSQTKAQHYPEVWLSLVISFTICASCSITLYFVLRRANARKAASVGDHDEAERAKMAFQDLTDIENPYFRYSL
ncbi:major facilitator superfamily domain-containing protein [Podospora didyma]|uniref:Major facilitator superfamily domain-containing protein n=1 Tax=Podospora didyma TaxID=330526 RepID=A0AAE0U2C2_9PEZI|nr:major facilitator superfamily domain-containing protein [Podospora didyma]